MTSLFGEGTVAKLEYELLVEEIKEQALIEQRLVGKDKVPMFVAYLGRRKESFLSEGSADAVARKVAQVYGNDWKEEVKRKVKYEVIDKVDCTMYRTQDGSRCFEAIDKRSRHVVEAADMDELGRMIEAEYGELWTDHFDLDPGRALGMGMSVERRRMREYLNRTKIEDGGYPFDAVYKSRVGRKEIGARSPPVKRKGTIAKKDRQSLLEKTVASVADEASKWAPGVRDVLMNAYMHKTTKDGRGCPPSYAAVDEGGKEWHFAEREELAEWIYDRWGGQWREHVPQASEMERTRNKRMMTGSTDAEAEAKQLDRMEEIKDIVINAYIHRANIQETYHCGYAVRIGDTEYCSRSPWGCATVIHEHYGKHWRGHVPLATEAGRNENKMMYSKYGPNMRKMLCTVPPQRLWSGQIGRASCRERV